MRNKASDRFRFTPVKRTANIPRAWDRKPSTSYVAPSKRPRTVWKRFRTSFNSVRAFWEMMSVAHTQIEAELDIAINASRNAGALRGVKRRCLRVASSNNDDGDGEAEPGAGRGRSFLETKWEEMANRRRKIPDIDASCGQMEEAQPEGQCAFETGQQYATSDATEGSAVEESHPTTLVQNITHPETLHGVSGQKDESNLDNEPVAVDSMNESDATMTDQLEPGKEPAPAEQIVSAEQESTLARSALRSSLDGDTHEVLNNFLSSAQAKQDTKASMFGQETQEEKDAQEKVISDLPTPRSRRALEELDTNSPSPSPQKVRTASPVKADKQFGSQIRKDLDNKPEEQPESDRPASPTTRRSTRPRTPRIEPRTTISLRRAKGTEFVFVQKSEAQELALATRKNTRQNKGNSVLPKYALKVLVQQQELDESSPFPDDSMRKNSKPRKTVVWNDARLVEFDDGEKPLSLSPGRCNSRESSNEPSSSDSDKQPTRKESEKRKKGSSRRSTPSHSGNALAVTPTPPTPPPAKRRMRKVTAPPKTAEAAPPSSPFSFSGAATSPNEKRKKLTPRSPSSALFGTAPSRKTSSSTLTTTASKLPTPSASGNNNKLARSSAARGKSLFKANAGSTPAPKRIRSRS